jgi:hypothetical protein
MKMKASKAKPKPMIEPNVFVAMVPNYWGKGTTLCEAIINCRKAGGLSTTYPLHKFSIRAYVLPEGKTQLDVLVTGMGDIMYPMDAQPIKIQTTSDAMKERETSEQARNRMKIKTESAVELAGFDPK